MNSNTISIIVVGLFIGGVILYTRPSANTSTAQNVALTPAVNTVDVGYDTAPPAQATRQENVATRTVTKTATSDTPPTSKDSIKVVAPTTPKEQIIEIVAKSGYTPKVSQAKPDIPTILRMKTQSTYDCSSSVNIPSLNIRKILPADGVTDIPLPPQKLGTSLTVLCGMGMYSSVINFN